MSNFIGEVDGVNNNFNFSFCISFLPWFLTLSLVRSERKEKKEKERKGKIGRNKKRKRKREKNVCLVWNRKIIIESMIYVW